MNTKDAIDRSLKLRALYHKLERKHHGSEWTVEEDALAFLTDAGLVGRLAMAQQSRWPAEPGSPKLGHKLAECIWWLLVLADRMSIDIEQELEAFLEEAETHLA